MQSVDGDIRLSVAFDQKTITQSANELKKSIENSLKGTSGGGAEKAIESVKNAAENAQKALSEMGDTKASNTVASAAAESAQRIGNAFKSLKIPVDTTASTMKILEGNVAAAENKAELLSQKLESLKNAKTPTKEYADLEKEIEKAANAADEAEKKFQDAKAAFENNKTPRNFIAMEGAKEEAARAGAALDELIQKQVELENAGKAFKPIDEAAIQRTAAALQAAQNEADIARTRVEEFRSAVETQADQAAAQSATAAMQEEEAEIERVHAALNRMTAADWKAFEAEEQRAGAQREANRTSRTTATQLEQVGSVVKKVINPLGRFAKFVGNSTKKLLQHASASKKAKSSTFNFEGALKKGIRTILKYGFGIRSTYILFNKLRSAVKEGYKNLAGFSPEVNASISSILSSLEQFKNQLAAAFEPIVTVVAPYIKQLIDWANRGALAIAKFFGALTGRQTVYKAAEQNKQYIESLNDTADAAKDAQEAVEKYLSPLDDLNIYKDPNESAVSSAAEKTTSGQETPDYASMFTVEPIENKFIELTSRIKDRFSTIFEPIKTAWDKVGGQVKNSMTNTFSSVTGLIKSIGTSFSTVWQNGTGEAVAQNLFLAFTSVNDMIKNISDNFRNAWESGRGIEIADRLGTLFEKVSKKIKDVAASWAEWAKDVDFEPLLTGIRDLLDSVIALFDDSNKNFSLTEDLIQPIASWTIEEAIPAFLQLLSDFLTFVSTSGDTVAKALSDIWTSIFGDITPGDMLIAAINSISDLFKWLTEHQEVVEIITKIATVVLGVAGVVQVFSTVAGIVSGIGAAVAFLATPVGAIALLIGGIIALIISIKSNWETLKEALEIALEFWKEKFKELGEKIAGFWNKLKDGAKKAWESIKSVFGTVATFFGNIFSTAWEKVKAVFSKGGEIFKGIKEGILNAFKKVVNSLIDGINTVVAIPFKGINSALSAIHDVEIVGYQPFDWIKTIDVPQIPHLATGAVIPANREFLAVLGDQPQGRNLEAPEDLIRQIVREEAGRGNGIQHIHLHVGSREIAEAVVEGGRVIMGQTGANPFVMA